MCVYEVALRRIEAILQPANKDVVIGTKRVVHADHIVRAFEFRGRIPGEPGIVKTVAHSGKDIRSWSALDKSGHRWIWTNALGIITTSENVEGIHTVGKTV